MSKYSDALWHLYDYIFYSNQTKTDRKDTITKMICQGLTPREAIQEMRDYEYAREHGPSD